MRRDAAYWINTLQLKKHIEGGYYRENYRSQLNIYKDILPESFHGDRSAATCIYFLLEKDSFSAFHKIASDEIWHFYSGDCLIIYEIKNDGSLLEHRLGPNPESHESFQVVVKAGNWFAAKLNGGGEYALAGCTVSPGFDFDDFEMAKREILLRDYPEYESLIISLTS